MAFHLSILSTRQRPCEFEPVCRSWLGHVLIALLLHKGSFMLFEGVFRICLWQGRTRLRPHFVGSLDVAGHILHRISHPSFLFYSRSGMLESLPACFPSSRCVKLFQIRVGRTPEHIFFSSVTRSAEELGGQYSRVRSNLTQLPGWRSPSPPFLRLVCVSKKHGFRISFPSIPPKASLHPYAWS